MGSLLIFFASIGGATKSRYGRLSPECQGQSDLIVILDQDAQCGSGKPPRATWSAPMLLGFISRVGSLLSDTLSMDEATVREMRAQGLGPTAIAKLLGIGRASAYRVLEA